MKILFTGNRHQGVSRLYQAFCEGHAARLAASTTAAAAITEPQLPYSIVRHRELVHKDRNVSVIELPDPSLFFAAGSNAAPLLAQTVVLPFSVHSDFSAALAPDSKLRALLIGLERASSSDLVFPITMMDRVAFSEAAYGRAASALESELRSMSLATERPPCILPVAVDTPRGTEWNVLSTSEELGWYSGPNLLDAVDSTLEAHGDFAHVGQLKASVQTNQGYRCLFDFGDLELKADDQVFDPAGEVVGKVIQREGNGYRVLFEDRGYAPSKVVAPEALPEPRREFRALLWTERPTDFEQGSELTLQCDLPGGRTCRAEIVSMVRLARSSDGTTLLDCHIRLAHPYSVTQSRTSPELSAVQLSEFGSTTPLASGFVSSLDSEAKYQACELLITDSWVAEQMNRGSSYPLEAHSKGEPSTIVNPPEIADYYSWFQGSGLEIIDRFISKRLAYSDSKRLEPLLRRLLEWERLSYVYPFFTERKRTRDHFLHVVRTAVLGDFFLSLQVNDGRTTILDEVCRQLQGARRYGTLDPQDVRRTWWIAALFHDCSYPLYAYLSPLQASEVLLSEYSEAFGDVFLGTIVKDGWRRITKNAAARVEKELGELVDSLELPAFHEALLEAATSLDHGALSAYVVQSLVSQRDDQSMLLDPALQAIAVHNFDTKGVQIRFTEHPIAWLLCVCDELQEWGRPIVAQEDQSLPLEASAIIELDSLAIRGLETDGRTWRVADGNGISILMNYHHLTKEHAEVTNFKSTELYAIKESRFRRLHLDSDVLPDFEIWFEPPSFEGGERLSLTFRMAR